MTRTPPASDELTSATPDQGTASRTDRAPRTLVSERGERNDRARDPDQEDNAPDHPVPSPHRRSMTGTHAIGYVRVSTEEQAASGLGLEAQEAAIRAECARRGWTVEVVADRGASGKQVNPELRRALALLDAGQADALVVAKLDRLARSVRHASAIIDDAIAKGWALVVLDNAIDLTTPGGRAMARMLATFAELERDLIGARTREALAARRARGEVNGRRTAIPAGLLRRIVLAHDAGASFGAIAADLTREAVLSPTGLPTWHESTVRRAYATATRTAVPA